MGDNGIQGREIVQDRGGIPCGTSFGSPEKLRARFRQQTGNDLLPYLLRNGEKEYSYTDFKGKHLGTVTEGKTFTNKYGKNVFESLAYDAATGYVYSGIVENSGKNYTRIYNSETKKAVFDTNGNGIVDSDDEVIDCSSNKDI